LGGGVFMGNMRISNKINVIVALFATRLSIGRDCSTGLGKFSGTTSLLGKLLVASNLRKRK
jgi:hypothetical protein